jgi:hypothetical protein
VAKDRWPACADAVAYDFRKEARRLATAAPVEAGQGRRRPAKQAAPPQ